MRRAVLFKDPRGRGDVLLAAPRFYCARLVYVYEYIAYCDRPPRLLDSFHSTHSLALRSPVFLSFSVFSLSFSPGTPMGEGLEHPVWVQLSDVSYVGPSIVGEGERLMLHCRMSIFDAARWTRNGRYSSGADF